MHHKKVLAKMWLKKHFFHFLFMFVKSFFAYNVSLVHFITAF